MESPLALKKLEWMAGFLTERGFPPEGPWSEHRGTWKLAGCQNAAGDLHQTVAVLFKELGPGRLSLEIVTGADDGQFRIVRKPYSHQMGMEELAMDGTQAILRKCLEVAIEKAGQYHSRDLEEPMVGPLLFRPPQT